MNQEFKAEILKDLQRRIAVFQEYGAEGKMILCSEVVKLLEDIHDKIQGPMPYTVIASKTFPHEADYSPAYIDSFSSIGDAMKALQGVRDYPYSTLEYQDDQGRRWDMAPQQVHD